MLEQFKQLEKILMYCKCFNAWEWTSDINESTSYGLIEQGILKLHLLCIKLDGSTKK